MAIDEFLLRRFEEPDEVRERLHERYAVASGQAYADLAVLRGDPSDGPRSEWTPTEGGLTYARELVELARTRGDFTVGVAAFPEGHPSAASLDHDAIAFVGQRARFAEWDPAVVVAVERSYEVQGGLHAGAVVTVAPVLILFLALQRYYIRGMLAGSVKG